MRAVIIKSDGTSSCVDVNMNRLHEFMGGDISFMGTINCDIVVVGLSCSENLDTNVYSFPESCESTICGDVLLVETDDEGNPVDMRYENVTRFV